MWALWGRFSANLMDHPSADVTSPWWTLGMTNVSTSGIVLYIILHKSMANKCNLCMRACTCANISHVATRDPTMPHSQQKECAGDTVGQPCFSQSSTAGDHAGCYRVSEQLPCGGLQRCVGVDSISVWNQLQDTANVCSFPHHACVAHCYLVLPTHPHSFSPPPPSQVCPSHPSRGAT